MAIKLRPAQSLDVAQIRLLVRDAYALYLDRMDREPAPMAADYAALVTKGLVTVAASDGILAGIIVCYPRNRSLHVENVAVDPIAQRMGVGHALMDHAETKARNAGLQCVELYTNEVMTENIGFYEARGFIICERAEQDGYARIFFEKWLA